MQLIDSATIKLLQIYFAQECIHCDQVQGVYMVQGSRWLQVVSDARKKARINVGELALRIPLTMRTIMVFSRTYRDALQGTSTRGLVQITSIDKLLPLQDYAKWLQTCCIHESGGYLHGGSSMSGNTPVQWKNQKPNDHTEGG